MYISLWILIPVAIIAALAARESWRNIDKVGRLEHDLEEIRAIFRQRGEELKAEWAKVEALEAEIENLKKQLDTAQGLDNLRLDEIIGLRRDLDREQRGYRVIEADYHNALATIERLKKR